MKTALARLLHRRMTSHRPTNETPHESDTLESLMRWMPGFAGYWRQEDRGRSDRLERDWLAQRLQLGKQGLERYSRGLVDRLELDAVGKVDRIRGQVDQLIGRIRGAVRGDRGFFGNGADATRVEKIYQHDLSLIEQVAAVADSMEQLGDAADDPPADSLQRLKRIVNRVIALNDAWDTREELLKE